MWEKTAHCSEIIKYFSQTLLLASIYLRSTYIKGKILKFICWEFHEFALYCITLKVFHRVENSTYKILIISVSLFQTYTRYPIYHSQIDPNLGCFWALNKKFYWKPAESLYFWPSDQQKCYFLIKVKFS